MSPNEYDLSPRRLSVRIDPEMKVKLESIAKECKVSLSQLVIKTMERIIQSELRD